MNLTRILVFCIALVAAGAAVVLVRGLLSSGTPVAEATVAPPPVTADVLVASKDIPAGRALAVDAVRWDTWPKGSVSDQFIVKTTQPDIAKAVEGVIVRSPMVSGQPITESSIVRAGSAGFMAATIAPGMRALSIPISAETGAGGFILPNDRVDVILTRQVAEINNKKFFATSTILKDVRVLGIDQTAEPPKDQNSAVGKTATVELTLRQAELVATARAIGTLALALRPLGDSNDDTALTDEGLNARDAGPAINIIRYGIGRGGNPEDERTNVQ
jgi:pilus assembly protein CpaB